MRRLALLVAVFALGLVIACGGGDDDGGDGGDGGNGDGNNEPTATAAAGDSGGGNDDNDGDDDRDNDSNGGGGNDDFCSPQDVDAVFEDLDFSGLDPEALEEQFNRLDEALDHLEDRAPNEIEDDVKTVAEGMRGLIELLEENDYNFFALATAAEDDPRFLALDDPKFQEASDRIAEYCGFDNDVPASSGGGSVPGGGGGAFSVDLPEDFPEDLVPPDSTIGFAGNVGFGDTVEFTSTATAEEVKSYYEGVLGDPTFADSESILWSSATRNVTISGTDGAVTVIVILLGN